MQNAMETIATTGYLSDGGDTTAESINFAHWSQMQDGTIEVTDRLPKKEYYLSLRRLNNTVPGSETMQRIGSISSGSALAPMNGSSGLTAPATACGTLGPSGQLTGTIARSNTGTLRGRSNAALDFKPSGKIADCTVVMLDGTTREFRLDRAAYGLQLFEHVCTHLGLLEVEYFGITYYDATNNWFWLDLNQKVSKQLGKNNWQFEFQVRFYPYDIDGIREDLTRYYLCLQVRQDIVSGQLPCSFMTYCLLGAYIVQSEAGDHDPSQHVGIKYIQDHPFAPHLLQTPEMLERIALLHKLHRGKTPEEADRSFLLNARCLALYGVDLHKVKNSQDKDVNLGVYHGGILLYRNRIRLMRISWLRIISLSHRGRNFVLVLRPTDTGPTDRNMSFKCMNTTFAKRLYNVCVEHHGFFRLRGSSRPKKPSFLPSFASRKYHYPSSILHSPTLGGPVNGASRPLSQFRPIPAHPNDTDADPDGRMNGTIASQYLHQPAMFSGDVNALQPVYMDGNHAITNGHPITGPQGAQRYLPASNAAPGSGGGGNGQQPFTRPTFHSEHWRISPADRTAGLGTDTLGLDVAAQRGAGWQGCRANKGVKAPGAYYYEVVCLEDGLIRVGWSTNDASLDLGSDNCGFGFGSDGCGASGADGAGRAMHRNSAHDYGLMVRKDDVIGCLLDLDKGSVAWSHNGKEFPRGFTIPDQLRGEAFLPAVSLKDSRILFNFGDQSLDFPPGGPFTSVAQASDDNEVPNRNVGWRLNPYDTTAGTDVAPDGSMAQAHFNRGWQGCRANQGIRGPGRFYFEVTPLEHNGLCRAGWSTEEGSLNLGSDRYGFGYGADTEGFGLNGQQGKRMNTDEIDNYGEAYGKGDVIGCFLDTVEHTIKWSKNGVDFGDAYQIPTDLPAVFFPTVSLRNGTVEFNFGDNPFEFYPGPDWTPVCCAPQDQVRRSRRKGPERKVKGWSYIDPAALESVVRQHAKTGHVSALRTVERQEEDVLHSTRQSSAIHPTSSSPNAAVPRQLPPGAVPMPGMVGPSISPISGNGIGTKGLSAALRARISEANASIEESVTTNGAITPTAGPHPVTAVGAPVYNLRDANHGQQRVLNGEIVSVQRSEPQVETESYVDEHGKRIKRTIKRSEVTTTKMVSERIITSDRTTTDGSASTAPPRTNGLATTDEFDEDLDVAIMSVTRLDRDISVLSDTVGQVEIRAKPSGTEL